jgi:hypothetical protein
MFHVDDAVAEGDVAPPNADPVFTVVSTSTNYNANSDKVMFAMNGQVLFQFESQVSDTNNYGVYTCVGDKATLAPENCGQFFLTNYGGDN